MAKVHTHKMILGIDAGGTHTRFVLMDENGHIVHQDKRDSLHFMKVGFEGITKSLLTYVKSMEDLGYDPSTFKVAIGIAGYGQDQKIRSQIEEAIYQVFEEALIYNDAQFAHLSSLEGEDGVFVISGTGSIALFKENDVFHRSGGFGYLIDDAGSAFWIGKHIIQTFVEEVDGRKKRTELYDFLMDKLELNDAYEIVNLVFSQKDDYRNFIANLSMLTKDLKLDALEKIYKKAGQALADLANAFKPKKKTPISIGGGVLLNNKTVLHSFKEHIDDNYHFTNPKQSVEYAAYILHKKAL